MALDKIPSSADEVPQELHKRPPNANAMSLDTAEKQNRFVIDNGRLPRTDIISFNPNRRLYDKYGHDYRHLGEACEDIGFEPDEPSTEAPISIIHQMPLSPEARLRQDALEFACSDLECACPETVLMALEEVIEEARNEEAALIEDERRIEARISRIREDDEVRRARYLAERVTQ